MSVVHVIPCNDLVEHDLTEDCVCGPTPEPVRCEDGSIGCVITHHSLDGRELYETDSPYERIRPPRSEPSLAVRIADACLMTCAVLGGWVLGAIHSGNTGPRALITGGVVVAISALGGMWIRRPVRKSPGLSEVSARGRGEDL